MWPNEDPITIADGALVYVQVLPQPASFVVHGIDHRIAVLVHDAFRQAVLQVLSHIRRDGDRL